MNGSANQVAWSDAGWRVLFAFQQSGSRGTQAGRSAMPAGIAYGPSFAKFGA